jgi:acetyltransferase-like isoleucine patch superfamily enzyme
MTQIGDLDNYAQEAIGIKIWEPSNVYPSAKLGPCVSVGAFSEIGRNVEVGENTHIGAMCFIPEMVTIGKNCFIGPRCTFTNDKYPMSPRKEWLPTVVEDGARLGAAVTVVCGIRIGAGALVGSGSVVTKNVPAGETWCGVPARKHMGGICRVHGLTQ